MELSKVIRNLLLCHACFFRVLLVALLLLVLLFVYVCIPTVLRRIKVVHFAYCATAESKRFRRLETNFIHCFISVSLKLSAQMK